MVLLALVLAPKVSGAEDPFATCEARFAADPQDWQGCNCFYRVAKGQALHREAVQRVEAHRADDPDNPCLNATLGQLHLRQRGYAEAVPWLRQATEVFATRGQVAGEVYARVNLADALAGSRAEPEAVTHQLDLAESAARAYVQQPDDVPGLHSILHAEVIVQEAQILNRHGADLAPLAEPLEWVRREVPHAHASLRRDTLMILGNYTYSRGRFAEAEEFLAEAIPITIEAQDRFGEAVLRLNHASAVAAQFPRDPRNHLVDLFTQARDIAIQAGHTFAEIEAHKRLGKLLGGPQGRTELEHALDRLDALPQTAPVAEAGVLAALARQLIDEDPALARQTIDRVWALLRDADGWSQVYGWADRLAVVWATAPHEEALDHAKNLLSLVEELEALQSTEQSRLEVSSVWGEIYHWVVGQLFLAAEEGAPTVSQAFAVAERMRARRLREALANQGVDPAEGLSSSERQEWLDVQRALVGHRRTLLDPALPTAEREALLPTLTSLERQQDRLQTLAGQRQRDTFADTQAPIALEDLQSDLAEDEAVLLFQVGPWESPEGDFVGGSWLLTITRAAAHLERLPDLANLTPRVEVFVPLLMLRDDLEGRSSAALYDQLLANSLESLPAGVQRLHLIPGGPLHRLPWGVLRPNAEAPPLGQRFEIQVLPSATVWQQLQQRPTSQGLALALADPTRDKDPGRGDPRGTGPDPPSRQASGSRSFVFGLDLPPLPFTRREGRGAVRRLGSPGELLLGTAATESAIKTRAHEGLRLLHLGSHAVLDETHPQRSALVLAAGSTDEDGLLSPREIRELPLDGTVVVLGTCDSARGPLLRGEGALSLARAFLEGGARAVVASLWQLDDAESAALFDRFYHHLGNGETVTRALHLAQNDRLESGAPPAAWAGLVVLGDGETRVPVGARSWLVGGALGPRTGWLLAALAGLVLAVAILAWTRSRRRRHSG